jgi:NAD(P)-dependent dehydrogenase (short-subunit alcohol dehydrogenase family)
MKIAEMNIVVTGANGAVGSVVFKHFHKYAQSVIGTLISQDQDWINRFGELYEVVDLTNKSAVQTAVAKIHQKMGSIHGWVNIAGGFLGGKLVEECSEDWEKMIRMNFFTALHACQAILPIMKAQGFGRIINIGAQPALEGLKSGGPYSVSKAMVHTLSKTIGLEAGPNVTCNCLVPWTIDTPANRSAFPDARHENWTKREKVADKIVQIFESTENCKLKFV